MQILVVPTTTALDDTHSKRMFSIRSSLHPAPQLLHPARRCSAPQLVHTCSVPAPLLRSPRNPRNRRAGGQEKKNQVTGRTGHFCSTARSFSHLHPGQFTPGLQEPVKELTPSSVSSEKGTEEARPESHNSLARFTTLHSHKLCAFENWDKARNTVTPLAVQIITSPQS